MKKATNTDVLGHVVAVSMEKLCHRRIIEMGQGSKACGLLNMSQQLVNMYSTANPQRMWCQYALEDDLLW